jgi:hypothetical protein
MSTLETVILSIVVFGVFILLFVYFNSLPPWHW